MFQFKKFAIKQDSTAMKVGTDGVVLGAWVRLSGVEQRVLDIGTGTGLIALMLAQRIDCESIEIDTVKIDAVEIDKASAKQAAENVAASPWSGQIEVHYLDIKSFAPAEGYDLIVSNPPYFVDSLKSPSQSRTTARHTTQLNFAELVSSVRRLLNPNGRFCVILPIVESQLFDNEAAGQLVLVRRCAMSNSAGAVVKRYISEYRLHDGGEEQNQNIELEELAIRSGTPLDYSAEYRKLTRDFYLKF